MYKVETSSAMILFLVSAIRRVVIWLCIPLRITQELYWCFVHPPKPLGEQQDGTPHACTAATDDSVDAQQMTFWEEAAGLDHWWDKNSALAALHKFNKIRLRLVAEAYLRNVDGGRLNWEDVIKSDTKYLKGARVCDVGCGGGILSEALAEAGATVTGVDMVATAIGIAKLHWKNEHENPDLDGSPPPEYICKSVEALAEERIGAYDIVICSEVLEHVSNPEDFALHCCKLVRPGGSVIFTTVNRSIWALLGMIILPEDILGSFPRFLHRLYMCVKPEEVERSVAKMDFTVTKTLGLMLLPQGLRAYDYEWFASRFTGLNYAIVAQRAR